MSALIPATQEVATSSTSNSNLEPTLSPKASEKDGAPAAAGSTSQMDVTGTNTDILPIKWSFDSPAQQQGGLAQDDKVKGKQGGLAQDDRDSAGANPSKSRKNRSNSAPKGSTEAPKEPSTE